MHAPVEHKWKIVAKDDVICVSECLGAVKKETRRQWMNVEWDSWGGKKCNGR